MPDLTGDDYRAMAESYEVEPPRRDEMVGEPVLNPCPGWDESSLFAAVADLAVVDAGRIYPYVRAGKKGDTFCKAWSRATVQSPPREN